MWTSFHFSILAHSVSHSQGFIVDFYCHRAGLVVEVDGDIHDLQKEEDERREKVLSPSGMLRDPRWGCGLSALGMMRS